MSDDARTKRLAEIRMRNQYRLTFTKEKGVQEIIDNDREDILWLLVRVGELEDELKREKDATHYAVLDALERQGE